MPIDRASLRAQVTHQGAAGRYYRASYIQWFVKILAISQNGTICCREGENIHGKYSMLCALAT
jgi:hypothetical protein